MDENGVIELAQLAEDLVIFAAADKGIEHCGGGPALCGK